MASMHMAMNDVKISLATTYYDHLSDLLRGRVRAEGLTLRVNELPVEEIFFRMASHLEWDAAEFSMAKYVSMVAGGAPSVRAIPVFPSRVFRQSAFYVASSAGIRSAQDLAGRRVGIPEWTQTAGIYARGYLQHQCGVRLRDIHWVQGGVDEAGRVEKAAAALPQGVVVERVRDRALGEMLLAGELDAIISAREPSAFVGGDARVTRLWPDYRAIEEAYYLETGIFPIMHVIVIKAAMLERHPWMAMNLYKAFEEAKANSLRELVRSVRSRVPFAWSSDAALAAQKMFGEDFWPYGIAPNRTTLEAFLLYCREQGVANRQLRIEELFPPGFDEFSKT